MTTTYQKAFIRVPCVHVPCEVGDILSCSDELTDRYDDIISRHDDIISRSDELISHSDELISRSDDIRTRSDDLIGFSDNIISRGNELLNIISMSLHSFHFHPKNSYINIQNVFQSFRTNVIS